VALAVYAREALSCRGSVCAGVGMCAQYPRFERSMCRARARPTSNRPHLCCGRLGVSNDHLCMCQSAANRAPSLPSSRNGQKPLPL